MCSNVVGCSSLKIFTKLMLSPVIHDVLEHMSYENEVYIYFIHQSVSSA